MEIKPQQQTCPHLGLKSDPTTIFSYPSSGNTCQHAKGKPTPRLDYQASTCLTLQHVDCPVFKNSTDEKMPKELRQPKERTRINQQMLLMALFLLIIFMGVLLGVIFRESLFKEFSRFLTPAWQQTQQALPTGQPTILTEATITSTQIPSPSPQPTNSPTSTIQPTASPVITREPVVLTLNTPIGNQVKFIIIQVNAGEALGQFASRYNTTETAIRAVNFDLQSVLYINRILIVPINITDTSGLPAFQAVQITEGGISVEFFAQQQAVAAEELYLYNDIQPGRILNQGEWILVPRN